MILNWRKKPDIKAINIDGVEFLGDQNGPPERDFKARILEVLENSGVSKAYLARVRYADGRQNVALCISEGTAEKQELVERLGADFKILFRPDVSLDILFLTPAQAERITSVCIPFFSKP
jgi:hypothetical protein